MCDPVTLGLTALTAAGTATSAISQVRQSNYQARVAGMNARLENDAARDAILRGQIESRRYQNDAAQFQGAQRASMAANGIDITFGSAAAVRADSIRAAEEDAQTIRENANRESRGFEINAANFTAQRQASRSAAKAAAVKGVFDLGSTVLGGAQQYRATRARLAAS